MNSELHYSLQRKEFHKAK